MPLIFILDDDNDTLFAMEFWLKKKGFSVKSFINTEQMLLGIREELPDIFLLDIHLKDDDGREVCKYLKIKEKLNKPVFLISTFPDSCKDFTSCKADDLMEKPYNMKELPNMLQSRLTA